MDFTNDIGHIKELLEGVANILIVTHEQPSFDSIGSALALSQGLTAIGKKVTVACPDPMTVALSHFIGVNKIVSEIGKKNFIISLDYVDGSIEKVSYNIEGNKFNLVIEPRSGFDTFSSDKVAYSNSGQIPDMIFTVGTANWGGLKGLYENNKEQFADKPVINIDRHPANANYGTVNIVDQLASTTAELVAMVLAGLGAGLTADMATNLLNAVYSGTNNFQLPIVSAGAFDVAGACVKAGGRRFGLSHEESTGTMPLPKTALSDVMTRPSNLPTAHAPADWLKPKIFKSSTTV